jgi:hypothetical protein
VHGGRRLEELPEIRDLLPTSFSSGWLVDMSDDGRVFTGIYYEGPTLHAYRLVVPSTAFK